MAASVLPNTAFRPQEWLCWSCLLRMIFAVGVGCPSLTILDYIIMFNSGLVYFAFFSSLILHILKLINLIAIHTETTLSRVNTFFVRGYLLNLPNR